METFLKNYSPILLILAWFAYRWWMTRKVKQKLPELLRDGATIVDVRSPHEYASGNASGSMNIPLNELNSRVNEIPRSRAVIVCCASGTRSGMAKNILRRKGFTEVYNIGPWINLL